MKSALIAAVLVSISGSAFASDMPVYGEPAGFAWSGLYAGIHFGYAKGSSDLFIDGAPPIELSLDPDGFIGGVQVGINHQMANRFVLGAEADITYNNVSGTAVEPTGPRVVDSETEWSGSARLRAGYAYGRTLPYLTAGAAAAKYKLTLSDPGSGASINLHDETHIGWTAGAGVEHAFTDRWSARVEYRYTSFGEEDLSAASGLGAIANVDLSTHDIRVGLNYHF